MEYVFDWYPPPSKSGMPTKRKRTARAKTNTAAPAPTLLPTENEAVLAEFDQLLRSDSCRPFIRDDPDTKDRTLRWDIVGDADRNWLYVVVTKVGKNLRFAKVTDEPGGWSIGSQGFGVDAETLAIAGEMAEEICRKHQSDLAQ